MGLLELQSFRGIGNDFDLRLFFALVESTVLLYEQYILREFICNIVIH